MTRLKIFTSKCSLQNFHIKMSSSICSPQNVLLKMFTSKCSPQNVLLKMFSLKCSTLIVHLNLITSKCLPQNVHLKMFTSKCSPQIVHLKLFNSNLLIEILLATFLLIEILLDTFLLIEILLGIFLLIEILPSSFLLREMKNIPEKATLRTVLLTVKKGKRFFSFYYCILWSTFLRNYSSLCENFLTSLFDYFSFNCKFLCMRKILFLRNFLFSSHFKIHITYCNLVFILGIFAKSRVILSSNKIFIKQVDIAEKLFEDRLDPQNS